MTYGSGARGRVVRDDEVVEIERHVAGVFGGAHFERRIDASAGGGEPRTSNTPWQVAALGLTQGRLGYNPLPAVKGELEGHVKRLSVDLAEKVVGANLNRDTNNALVDRYIAELGAN